MKALKFFCETTLAIFKDITCLRCIRARSALESLLLRCINVLLTYLLSYLNVKMRQQNIFIRGSPVLERPGYRSQK